MIFEASFFRIFITPVIVWFVMVQATPAFAVYSDAGLAGSATFPVPGADGAPGEMGAKMAGVGIPFVANEGQMDEKVKFHAGTFGGGVFVTREGAIVYNLPFYENEGKFPGPRKDRSRKTTGGVALREVLVKGRVNPVLGEGAAPARIHYFKGRDASRWKSHVAAYDMVSLGEVYEGVIARLRAYGNNVEKLFFVQPGADAEVIRIRVDGAEGLTINDAGGLEVKTALGTVSFTAPMAYQETDGKRRDIRIAHVVDGNTYGFEPGNYDRTRELVIDPLLASTSLGGSGADEGHALALDPGGNVYVAGFTRSVGFPASPGAYGELFNGSQDAFVFKMDAGLTTLLAATFVGGDGEDACTSIALDANGDVYIGGETSSDDFPTTMGAYAETGHPGGVDGFVSKLSGDLGTLSASTYLGGDGSEGVQSLALEPGGGVYATGSTDSSTFPTTPGAYTEASNDGAEIFISKLDEGLAALTASTLLGGGGDDFAYDLVLGPNGSVYVTGHTASPDFPATPGALDETYSGGTHDAFIARLNGDLTALLHATFLGGGDYDEASGAAMDPSGNIHVVGRTYSTDFPTTPGAYCETPHASGNVFISRLDGALATLSASTLLGGKTHYMGNAIALDPYGNVYVSGSSYTRDFPTTALSYNTVFNDYVDVFVSKLDPGLTTLSVSMFLGGDHYDYANSLALDPGGNVYVAGSTRSTDFPTTPEAYGQGAGAGYEVFVSKLDSDLSAGPYPPSIEVTEPDGVDDGVNLVETLAYTIRWEDHAMGDGAVSLYYDTDDGGVDGTLITDGIGENDESDHHVWDVSALPEGEYYVYAVLDDGVHPAAVDYGAGPVAIIHNEKPTIQVLEPDGNDTADLLFTIAWTDGDPDDAAAISLFYDANDSGEDGIPIAHSINEDNESDRYEWDVSTLSDGNYYVYAVIDDGINPPAADYGAGPLTVHHPPRLTISFPSGGLVSAPGMGTFTYSMGAVVPLAASPAPGHEFVEWTGDVAAVADVHAAATTITMNGSYTVAASFVNNQTPTIQILEPDGVGDDAHEAFTIRWSDSDPDNDADVSLYYDTDHTGRDGVLIAGAMRENDGADQYTWDVSALPDGDYWVYAVIDDGINPPTFDYGAGPITVLHSPRLTVSIPSDGLVSAPGIGTFFYSFGAVVPLAASPAPGHEFVAWTGDAPTVADVHAAATTITMNGNYTVSANFVNNASPTIRILEPDGVEDAANASFLIRWSDADPDNDADVSLYYDTDNTGRDGVLITGSMRENDGVDQYTWDVSALPDGDYWVYAVIDDGINSEVVDYGDGPVAVRHLPSFHELTISSYPGASVDLVGAPGIGAFSYSTGAVVPLAVAPFPGLEFVGWTGDVSTVGNVHAATTTISMEGDYAITANFILNNAPTVKVYEPCGVHEADAAFIIHWQAEDTDDDADVSLYYDTDDGGEDGTLIADSISENGSGFFDWNVSALADGVYYVYVVVDDGINLPVVQYSPGPLIVNHPPSLYELTVSGASGGSVIAPGEGTFSYAAGLTVNLVATPFLGHEFVGWTGDATAIADVHAAATTIIMNGNCSITADFTDISGPTIQVLEPDGVDDAADASFLIHWIDEAPDNDAAVSLYYDTDDAGRDGVLITGAIRENDSDYYSWDVSALPTGNYWVYAAIDDGIARVVDYSDGPVAVKGSSPFSTVWSGNPYENLGLWVFSAVINDVDLETGDQIAVFDGSDCVGLGIVSDPISYQSPLVIHCSQDDGDGNGFTPGHVMTFRLWDASKQREISTVRPHFQNITTGNYIYPPLFGSRMDYGVTLRGWRWGGAHYSLPYYGNPYSRMNLWITGVNGVALSPGDEIGVFDGDVCVGVSVVTGPISLWNFLIVTSSADDGDDNGFRSGNPIGVRIWRAEERREITDLTVNYFELANGHSIPEQFFGMDDDWMVYLKVNDDARVFEIVQPDGLDDVADPSCTITWRSDITNGDAEIHLFYDTDNAGEDGTPINAEAIRGDKETDSYEWSVSGVPDGEYYIYAVIDNGNGEPLVAYSSGPMTVGKDIPDVCTDPLGVCGSCQDGSECYDRIEEGVIRAASDDEPFTTVVVGPGEYTEPVMIVDSMVVILPEGTVTLAP